MSDDNRFSSFAAEILAEADDQAIRPTRDEVKFSEQKGSDEQENRGVQDHTEQDSGDFGSQDLSSEKKSFEKPQAFCEDAEAKKIKEKKKRKKQRKERKESISFLPYPELLGNSKDLIRKNYIKGAPARSNVIHAREDQKLTEKPVADEKLEMGTKTHGDVVDVDYEPLSAKQDHSGGNAQVDFEPAVKNVTREASGVIDFRQAKNLARNALKRSEKPVVDEKSLTRTKTPVDPVKASDEPLSEKQGISEKARLVNLVIAHYKTHHPRARPGQKERALVNKRLSEGYSVEDLTQAIDGCHMSDFHCGNNDQGKKYQQLSLIMRDSSKVADFIEIASGSGTVNKADIKRQKTDETCKSFLEKMSAIARREQSRG